MQKKLQNIIQGLFAVTIILSVLAVSFCNTHYLHFHNIDGQKIAHSHLYQKSDDNQPTKSHQHSNSEFFGIKHLSEILILITVVLGLILLKKSFIYFENKETFNSLIGHFRLHGRAPPISNSTIISFSF